jgi:hypothetical protein
MVEKWSKQWIKGIAQMLERFLEKGSWMRDLKFLTLGKSRHSAGTL